MQIVEIEEISNFTYSLKHMHTGTHARAHTHARTHMQIVCMWSSYQFLSDIGHLSLR